MSFENAPDSLQDIFRIEMNREAGSFYKFRSFKLDVAERQLLNNGVEIPLTPKAFDVLACLVERGGHLVEKEELMQRVWPDAFVEDANLTRTIHTLRKALGEDQNGNKFIATVAKKGYRFVADVEVETGQVAELPLEFVETEVDGGAVVPVEATEDPEAGGSEPRTNARYLLFASAAVMLGALILAAFVFFRPDQSTAGGRPASIAILPFRPLDETQRDQAYELFFANELINQISQERNLKVRHVNSIRGYTDVKQDPLAIGREQKADYVVESTYVVADGRLRASSHLIDVRTGNIEATFSYDADASAKYAAADTVVLEIGRDLLEKLRFKPLDLAPNRTVDEKAWNHYVHGMKLTNKRIQGDSDKAIVEFENAVRIDPNYADAYVGLAYAHETSYINGGDKAVHCAKGLEAVKRALEIAPNLAEAYTILAMNTLSCQGNRKEADELHKKAKQLSPNSPFVRRFYGIYLTNMAKGDESVEELKAAIDLDPNLPWTEKLLGRALFFARRYDEAIAQLMKTRELDAKDEEQTLYLFKSYEFNRDLDKAFEWFKVYESIRGIDDAGLKEFSDIYAASGWNGVLRKRLARAEARAETGEKNFGEIASLAAQVGETEKAFAYLEKALPIGQLFMAQILIEPTLDPLRSDPRFDSVIARNWTG